MSGAAVGAWLKRAEQGAMHAPLIQPCLHDGRAVWTRCPAAVVVTAAHEGLQ
jgi:hypothetical protein